MSFLPTHKGLDAIFRPLGEQPIAIKGDWDGKNYRFGVKSSNSEAVFRAHERASEEMVRLDEAWAATLELLGDTHNVRNVTRGSNYNVIIIALA